MVETAEKLLEIWGAPMTVRFSGKLPASAKRAADYDSGRRAVLAEGAALAAPCRGSRSGNGGDRGAG